MTISKVGIVNMALSNLGARSKVESFDEQTVESRLANLWYDNARQATLEAADWTFARKRDALALANDEAPLLEYTFRYKYPADCIRVRYIENPFDPQGNPIPYRIESSLPTNKTILTDMEDAVLVYTFDQTYTNLFSALFIDALSYRLSYHFAMPITGKVQLKTDMFQYWLAMTTAAQAHDANEEAQRWPRDGDSVRERGYNQRYLPTQYR